MRIPAQLIADPRIRGQRRSYAITGTAPRKYPNGDAAIN